MDKEDNKIYQLRMKMGLTQLEFAHLFLVNKSTISRWENNKRHMSNKHKYIFQTISEKTEVVECLS